MAIPLLPPACFVLKTLGCKTNQYEAEGIRHALEAAGYREVGDSAAADVCVLNTCAVTGRADASSRHALRAFRRRNPTAVIVVTGCCVDLGQTWVRAVVPDAVLVPTGQKHAIAALLAGEAQGEDERFAFRLDRFCGQTRAFVKIQDGCAQHCTYCTIPRARGRPVSRPHEAVEGEATTLIGAGHRELVLTGINIGAYQDPAGTDLASLVSRVGALPGLARLRLGSVEPNHVTSALLHSMAETSTVCAHLHVPLQSGDAGVLRRMARPYTLSEFEERVALARDVLPCPAITTDVIVGFPGEDEASFVRTLDFCEAVAFARTHVFLYSPRSGTPAADWPQGCPQRELTDRHRRLRAQASASAAAYAASFVGQEVRMLVETQDADQCTGYSDRYLRVRCRDRDCAVGELLRVKVARSAGSELIGEPVQA